MLDPPDPPDSPDSPDLAGLRLLAHPLRLRLLSLLTAQAMSAAEAARELGETQANVSYHLRRLHDGGLLELAEEVRVSGGRARRYRHDAASGPSALAAGPTATGVDHRAVAAALAAELQRRAARRRADERGNITDAEVWVDPDEWHAIVETVSGATERLHSAARPPHTPGTIPTSTTLAMFALDDRRSPGTGGGHGGHGGDGAAADERRGR
ncbi:helix-turn-helix domain-containing protein [Streptomonospora wellingtoniae]|uniref:Helix-turn-helix domain-containing protein n=1 Tax=Streptomonospora wellingtoniae TaxID=3075544 RepID=A0ABU2KZB6_9ACTN|nr:helix-turn-helix domain-containing protein [Streptomonospora sp. DSM 45055]MDT0304649.1 helix-turn-helix domain-containing protein [Streptomonospora sp. DSM 45055]